MQKRRKDGYVDIDIISLSTVKFIQSQYEFYDLEVITQVQKTGFESKGITCNSDDLAAIRLLENIIENFYKA